MALVVSQLELVWRLRPGGGGKTERRFLDFVVDGQSLYDALDAGDVVGCLGWGLPQQENEDVQVLLRKKPSSLHTGRVMLYVCAECGDIGCGAVTVRVDKTVEHFIWSAFGWENDYDPDLPDLEPYKALGPFAFNKNEYWQTLMQRPQP